MKSKRKVRKHTDVNDMDLLQVGDVFKSSYLSNISYGYKIYGNKPAELVISQLYLGSSSMGYTWTELIDGGFKKSHEEIINLRPSYRIRKRFSTGKWVVTSISSQGGGSDGRFGSYQSGHHVTAKLLSNNKWKNTYPEVHFYQTGSFSNKIEEGSIEKVATMTLLFSNYKAIRVCDHEYIPIHTNNVIMGEECTKCGINLF